MMTAESADSTMISASSGTASSSEASSLEQERSATKDHNTIQRIRLRIAQKYNKKRDYPEVFYQQFWLIGKLFFFLLLA
jgi:hypothetical protein